MLSTLFTAFSLQCCGFNFEFKVIQKEPQCYYLSEPSFSNILIKQRVYSFFCLIGLSHLYFILLIE